MNQIEKLIEELCPNGVEYKPLGEIFKTRNGYTPSKSNASFWSEGTIDWFRMEDIRENGRILNSSLQKINPSAVKGEPFPANTILVATSATIGEHALITVPHLSNQRFTALIINPEYKDYFDIKFIFYYCFNLSEWCKRNTTQSSFLSVDMRKFRKFLFPIPPLAIQNEIVKILDTFQSLEAELEAELEARKKQIGFYRDTLIHADSYPLIKFEDIAEFRYGLTATAQETGSYRFLRITDIDGNGKIRNQERKFLDHQVVEQKYFLSPGDLLIARTGASYGKCAIIEGEEQAVYASFLIRMKVDEEIATPRFVWHFMQSNHYWQQANFLVSKAGQPQFNANAIKRVTIPIPPLEEQQRIVNILDKFDALVNDLTSGLPAEIEARRKQYEYYRDQLLTFKELAA